ncbi:MAG: ABC transporter substrate-binding protein [Planctomycetaceae bacterium]
MPSQPSSFITALRRALPTATLLIGASVLLVATDRAGSRRTLPAIAVLKQVSTAVLDDAVAGMLAGLEGMGYRSGDTVTISQFNAEGDMAQANAIAREITGGGFDMVLTSSTPSLQAVATANERGGIVHVFAAVADPFSAGVGLDRSNPLAHPRHLMGYGSLAPVHVTFGILRRVNPRIARVGVAHNPSESNSRRFMELARASCRDRGIELLEAAVENSSGVVEAVQSTIARGAEAIFIPGDTTVASVCDSVVEVSGRAGVPVFTLVPGRPDRGTFFDVGFDFREVGLLAGRLAGELLGGRDPSTVPIGETAKEIPPRLTVNLSAPGLNGSVWRVPDDLLSQAKVGNDANGRRDQPEAVLAGPFDEAMPSPR